MDTQEIIIKRGAGVNSADIKLTDFTRNYRKHSKGQLSARYYREIFKELCQEFSELLLSGKEIKMTNLGRIRICARPMLFHKIKRMQPDWKATRELWKKQYPNLTAEEILKIKNKTILRHENDHTSNEYYQILWDKVTLNNKGTIFYKFVPARLFKRKLSEIVRNPQRKIFYYGK